MIVSLADGDQFKLAVPVIGPGNSTPIGTAFLVFRDERNSVLMTARHVAEADDDLALAVPSSSTTSPDGDHGQILLRRQSIAKVLPSDRYDVALLIVHEHLPELSQLPFGRSKSLTTEFFNIEYSQSLREEKSTLIAVEPSYHRGCAVRRTFIPDRLTANQMSVMTLPWSAWKGASGSPVIEMNESGWTIAGMVLENQESERLPAHLETTVMDDGKVVESVKYFVPNAVAICERHLREVMTEEFGRVFRIEE